MEKIFTLFLFFAFLQTTSAQTINKILQSQKMGEEREIKIKLPPDYDTEKSKKYPLIIVLDGDYLFEPMVGSADYFTYWDEIPQPIIVGINQKQTRFNDTSFDSNRFLPFDKGARFFEFLGMELLPFLNQNYRTSKFVMVAGHDVSANFINYYLLKPEPIFQAYLNLSPDFAPEMANRLREKFSGIDRPTWFYLATASNDVSQLRTQSLQLNEHLSIIENKNFNYIFEDFERGDHYTFPAKAIPSALEQIFKPYAPISSREYDEILAGKDSPYLYLAAKYETIKKYFQLDIPIRKQDFLIIGRAIEERKEWQELEKLGRLASNHHPNHTLGTYYLARVLEETGEPKKAMQVYRSAFEKKDVSHITVDYMMQRAEAIKRDFNY